jgi:hypothetical protein
VSKVRAPNWRQRADLAMSDALLLGEDEFGDLWVPSRQRPGWWDRRFSAWRPTHWRYWLRSRRLCRLAVIELDTSEAAVK